MTTETFINRIEQYQRNARNAEKILKKNGNFTIRTANAVANLETLLKGGKLHLKHWERGQNSNYYRLEESDANYCELFCKVLRLSYLVGNDAARGGKAGWYIRLTAAGRRQLGGVDFEKLNERI